jgi:thiazole synthase
MMATSMKHAVLAGRKSYLAGRIGLQKFGLASSPNEGLI